MVLKGSTCPRCGSQKITIVQVPRQHGPTEPPSTQPAFRCLGCDTQWLDDAQWSEIHGPE